MSSQVSHMRHLRSLSKFEQNRIGSKFKFVGNANLPCVHNLGLVERREQECGQVITTVYPKMMFRKTRPVLRNLKFDSAEDILMYKRYRSAVRPPIWVTQGFPNISEECVSGTNYYFEDGFRKVHPYYFVYETVINSQKVYHRSVLQVMKEMFPNFPLELLKIKIERGDICVNLERVQVDTVLKEYDLLTHVAHLHESPALDVPIDIIYEDEDLLVVNKPPGLVIHPVAGHRLNSIPYVLMIEQGRSDLRHVHRLDKLTSGVLILTKTPEAAAKYSLDQQKDGTTKKEYLALVDGEFPAGETLVDSDVTQFTLNAVGIKRQMAKPKESKTIFERLEYDGRTSLLRCELLTGRTHQIRQHLKQLGFAIVNDDLYNPLDSRVPIMEVLKSHTETAMERIIERHKATKFEETNKSCDHPGHKSESEWLHSLKDRFGTKSPFCLHCEIGPEVYRKVTNLINSPFMCLHSWKYSLGNKSFEAPMPAWAMNPELVDKVFQKRMQTAELL